MVVKCDWKPAKCEKCCVFSHSIDKCGKHIDMDKEKSVDKEVQGKTNQDNGSKFTENNDGFKEVQYRKNGGIGVQISGLITIKLESKVVLNRIRGG